MGCSHTSSPTFSTALQAARLLGPQSASSAYDQGLPPHDPGRPRWRSCSPPRPRSGAIDVAIQVHGARALEECHPLEHLYREVRATRIYEGASEVQREIIARQRFRGV